MRAATIFCALPAEHTRLIGLDAHQVAAAGDHVELARQARDPETVDDISGLELQNHRPPGGNVKLVGVLDDLAPLPVEISNAPPPHLARYPPPKPLATPPVGPGPGRQDKSR